MIVEVTLEVGDSLWSWEEHSDFQPLIGDTVYLDQSLETDGGKVYIDGTKVVERSWWLHESGEPPTLSVVLQPDKDEIKRIEDQVRVLKHQATECKPD